MAAACPVVGARQPLLGKRHRQVRDEGACQDIAAAIGAALSSLGRDGDGPADGAEDACTCSLSIQARRAAKDVTRAPGAPAAPGDDIVFRQACDRDGPRAHRRSLMRHTPSVQRAPSPAPPGQPARGFSRRVQRSLRRSPAQPPLGHRWETEASGDCRSGAGSIASKAPARSGPTRHEISGELPNRSGLKYDLCTIPRQCHRSARPE